jgi:acetyltransferase-like isoleucine patch superfamily enzyme
VSQVDADLQPGNNQNHRADRHGTLIGSGAIVMANVGHNSVVGAGSVVTKPLPDNVVAAGVPARVIRQRLAT